MIGSYHAHNENILTALLHYRDIDKIIKIREGQDNPNVGNTCCRPHHTTDINMDATSVRDLTNWEKTEIKKYSLEKIYEPEFRCKMNIDVIQFLQDEPFSVHTVLRESCPGGIKSIMCSVWLDVERWVGEGQN